MRFVLAWAVVFLLAASIRVGATETSPDPSNHVPLDHWAYGAMEYLVEAGVYENKWLYSHLFSGEDRIERTRRQFEYAVSWALCRTERAAGGADESSPPSRLTKVILFELSRWLSSQESSLSIKEPLSAYDEVPTEHWAYGVLDYFIGTGVLQGYPDGYFSEERVLTCYELAAASARLLDTMSSCECSYSDYLLAEALEYEFHDQLSQHGRMTTGQWYEL